MRAEGLVAGRLGEREGNWGGGGPGMRSKSCACLGVRSMAAGTNDSGSSSKPHALLLRLHQ